MGRGHHAGGRSLSNLEEKAFIGKSKVSYEAEFVGVEDHPGKLRNIG